MGLQERGQAALNRRQKVACATTATITYHRAAGGSGIDLTGKMWRGETRVFRNPLQDGPTVVFAERDYLVTVADLAVGGVPFAPAEGDRVVESLAGVETVYEVLVPFGEDASRYSDAGRTRWRIHVKEVSA